VKSVRKVRKEFKVKSVQQVLLVPTQRCPVRKASKVRKAKPARKASVYVTLVE